MEENQKAVLSVSQVNVLAKDILESSFPNVLVEGEISNLAQPGSGHCYFSLKDEKSQLKCALFAGSRRRLRFDLENGQKVLVKGKLSIFGARGDMQLIVSTMEPAGEGDLRRQFEALKLKLSDAGWFDEHLKKPLPLFCKHLAVITSPSGAAVRDILHVLNRRFPLLEITIIPSLVQGNDAAGQLCQALERANNLKKSGDERFQFDTVLLARGGGSLEDLWPFNDEALAKAIYESELPVISGVGHETDTTIADWVSDFRAPTPSAAAETISQDQEMLTTELEAYLAYFKQAISRKLAENHRLLDHLSRLNKSPNQKLREQAQKLDYLEQSLQQLVSFRLLSEQSKVDQLAGQVKANNPDKKLALIKASYLSLRDRLLSQFSNQFQNREREFAHLVRQLNNLSPLQTLERGYSISRLQTDKGLTLLSSKNPGDIGQTLLTNFHGGSLESTIIKINPEPDPGINNETS